MRWLGFWVLVAVSATCAGLWAASSWDLGPFKDLPGLAGAVGAVAAVASLAVAIVLGAHQLRGRRTPTPAWVSNAAPTSRADLARLGVHSARPGPDGSRQPPYVPRDADDDLDRRLGAVASDRRGGMVLVSGGSMAGKSRALAAALARSLPKRRLVVPPEDADLTHLPAWLKRHRWRGRRGWVVWLDDLDRRLPHARLEPPLIEELGRAGAIVAATIRWQQLQNLKPATESDGRAVGYAVLRTPALVLADWSPEERDRASRSGDERLVEGAAQETVGVAAHVGGGPQLEDLWRHGPAAGHPRGYALVAAAVDLARTGLSASLARGRIEEVAELYLPPPPPAAEAADEAWGWATRVRHEVAGLLVPADHSQERWRALDYLTREDPVPAAVWEAALEEASEEDRRTVGVTAYTAGRRAVAETAWRTAVEAGDIRAMRSLGVLLKEDGRTGEAEQWWRRAAEAGDTGAMHNLGVLLKEDGRTGEAEQWWRRAAEAGHTEAMHSLGVLLKEDGRTGEAEQWWRRAAEAGDTEAMFSLGVLLYEGGRTGEAEQWWRRVADNNHTNTMFSLGVLLKEGGRTGEAEQWWRRAAEAGHTGAMHSLGVLLKVDGRTGEAEQWYRRAAEAGHTGAMVYLGLLLYEDGRNDEAGDWMRRAREAKQQQ
ncbi:TPR repeat protein [Streptomonospora salina]|uniref:TPR repeat protein n=1 Tax=Streptomonospora salina TaxID=104205 RepID=A0A841EDT0_9ACTN|nr:tetratricopeptide repeat protein [Streptomonospora salina]MBB6001332.1 TPR repeat protein [Streptomonospora salina]